MAPELKHVISLNQDPAFQNAVWHGQRIGWGLLALILLATALGVFGGSGPWARSEISSVELTVNYPQFTRQRSENFFLVRTNPTTSNQSSISVWLDRSCVNLWNVTAVTPAPVRVRIAEGGFLYDFLLASPGLGAELRFNFQPETWGAIAGQIGLEGTQPVTFHTYIYP